MPVIVFDPQRQQPPRTGAYCLDGHQLTPGRNAVGDADLSVLIKHPDWDTLVELGAISMYKESAGGLPESDALTLINTAQAASEIEVLPGIGAVSAGLIFAARPDNGYLSLEAVQTVPDLPTINWSTVAAWTME